MKRILVTGSRNWTDAKVIEQALVDAWDELGGGLDVLLVHGACPQGADAIADRLWPGKRERHPADWARHGKAAGPIRNQEMVDLGADLVLAFPFGVSRGTWGCVRMAVKAGLPVRLYRTDGAWRRLDDAG